MNTPLRLIKVNPDHPSRARLTVWRTSDFDAWCVLDHGLAQFAVWADADGMAGVWLSGEDLVQDDDDLSATVADRLANDMPASRMLDSDLTLLVGEVAGLHPVHDLDRLVGMLTGAPAELEAIADAVEAL